MSIRVPHADHDPLLIVRAVDGDLAGPERADAERRIGGCPACASLAADLRSIALATAHLPAAPRRRDFRLTEADAARLRPADPWRRLVGALAGPRFAFSRPLGGAFVALGLAGLLLTSLPTLGTAIGPFGGAGAGAPAEAPEVSGKDVGGAGSPTGAPAPTTEGLQAPAAGSDEGDRLFGRQSDTLSERPPTVELEVEDGQAGSTVPVLGISAGLALVGVGLLLARLLARRAARA